MLCIVSGLWADSLYYNFKDIPEEESEDKEILFESKEESGNDECMEFDSKEDNFILFFANFEILTLKHQCILYKASFMLATEYSIYYYY